MSDRCSNPDRAEGARLFNDHALGYFATTGCTGCIQGKTRGAAAARCWSLLDDQLAYLERDSVVAGHATTVQCASDRERKGHDCILVLTVRGEEEVARAVVDAVGLVCQRMLVSFKP